MKFSNASLLGLVLCITVLLSGACSYQRIIPTSPSVTASINTPVQQPANVEPMLLNTPTPMTALLPFNGKIAFIVWNDAMLNNRIYVMKANGSEQTDITPANLYAIRDLAWSPDGQYLAFDAIAGQLHQIFKIKSDGSGLVQLTFREEDAQSPSWSPDGKYIIFDSTSPDILGNSFTSGPQNQPVTQIYIMKADGSEVRRITVKTRNNNVPMSGQYRNDGLISVSEQISRQGQINYVVDSKGVIQKQFPQFEGDTPIWSPDGNFFIRYSFLPPSSDCSGDVIMKLDDNVEMCLKIGDKMNPPMQGYGYSWSPDGNYILMTANLENDNAHADLYVMKLDGSNLTRLTYLSTRLVEPVWSAAP